MNKNLDNLNIIMKCMFGSHLYGTATKESDTDYKGIYLPSKREVYLNRISKSYLQNTKQTKLEGLRNDKEDIDCEIYSLHYFVKLACEGQTVALDMLHAPKDMISESTFIWDEVVKNKEKFYTKNLNSFVGYARKQAAKYGIKGSRLSDAKLVLDKLRGVAPTERLSDYWFLFPESDHLHHIENSVSGLRQYQVCGKILQESMKVSMGISIVDKYYTEYGKRAQLAADNQGIDWKAISHAFRAAYQVKSLLTKNTIIFPLPEADYLIKIKQGMIDYQTEAAPNLENLMDECEKLTLKSSFPNKVDKIFWDNFIIEMLDSVAGWRC